MSGEVGLSHRRRRRRRRRRRLRRRRRRGRRRRRRRRRRRQKSVSEFLPSPASVPWPGHKCVLVMVRTQMCPGQDTQVT